MTERVKQGEEETNAVSPLFEAPEALARRSEAAGAAGQIACLPLLPIARGGALPLSFAQQRLWFFSQLEGSSNTYNISAVMRLRGSLDDGALVRALQAVVARHEVLRTRFREVDGVPMQVIDEAGHFAMRRLRLPAPGALSDVVNGEMHSPFDLSRDALFRALLIEEEAHSHVLVLVLHQSIADGGSLGVLMKELSALYAAFHEGRPSPLPPPAVQYADFAHWQRERLTGDVLAGETAYWKAALASLPPMLELPTDRPRPPVRTYRGAHEPFRLSAELTERLLALSRRSGATLFMTLFAAYDILLSRYSGQTDIAVGTPVANRTRPELESLIGLFINNLVLRTDLGGDPTFRDLLAKVRETVINAYAHQDVPFEYLVEQLNPTRSLSYSPLFQVMFVLQDAPPASMHLPDLEVAPLPFEQQATTQFDLVLSLTQTAEGLGGALEYSTDLFDRATIARMLDHYGRLLEAIADNPEERISRYELLGEEERRRILVEWNRRQDFPQEQTMHGLVEALAERTPDVTALVFKDRHLTYRAWNARANRLARYLVGQGVRPETRVGLCIDRSLEMMVGILAILKAGGAYVPLDPGYPKARLDYIVTDAQVQCVITQSHLRDLLGSDVPCICLDEARAVIARQSDEGPDLRVDPLNLAYVIHTSGSTGQPKGVMIAHRGVVNLTYAQQKQLEGIPGSRVLQFASFSFDGSVWEFVMAWIRGTVLVLGTKRQMQEGDALAELMNREAIDIATLPPSALAVLDPKSLPTFKVLISAGEALSMAQVMPWLEGRIVMNGYGPTESTVDACVGHVRADEPITVGRSIPNIAIYILDGNLRPVPIGATGEVHIGGEGLARGYLNRPGLTAERFLPNPFGSPGSRMYCTGDLARYRPDGPVEILGRSDHQVKVRGFRIELGEIEATLERHPAVAQALVIASGEGEAKRLIAYYTTSGEAPALAQLRIFLSTTLPEHMVPAFFIALDAFPLTPNAKIDRAALPAPDVRGAAGRQYTAPRTPIEQTLAGIWQQVLRVPQVGVHDHFFEIGGHSLLATEAVSRINGAFSVALAARALFEAPDIERLARRVADAQRLAADERPPSDAEPSTSPLLLLSGREGGEPAVLIPGIVGVLQGYYGFAQALAEQRPVYGLHALSVRELGISHTIENIARLYVSSLVDVWDKGPFHLIGHSYGGIIAFEMVRQLEQQGHAPGSLILVDADPLPLKLKELQPHVFVLRYMLRYLRMDNIATADVEEGLESADAERLAAVLHGLVAAHHPGGSLGLEGLDQWVRTTHSRYIDAHAPAPYRPATEVLEIWAEHSAMTRSEGATPMRDTNGAWQQILQKQTDRRVVPGDHESAIGREHGPALARMVNDWIEETRDALRHPEDFML